MKANWIGSTVRKAQAGIHIDDVAREYDGTSVIIDDINDTVLYKSDFVQKTKHLSYSLPEVIVIDQDTVTALLNCNDLYPDKRICVLNFSSYTNPGGGFIKGAKAQEEDLCMESDLYHILSNHQEFYDENKKNMNKCLYTNRALYSHHVHFSRERHNNVANDKDAIVDVLTCAAPNYTRAKEIGVSREMNNFYLKNRIKYIKAVTENEGVDILIAGAYGCGVFGQDPRTVAEYFKECFEETSIGIVIYAIAYSEKNLKIFKEVMHK